MKIPFLGALFLCECHAGPVHLICQMRCRFSVLKRSALSRTFVWKLRIAVNLFTPIVEALTVSESFQSFSHNKSEVVRRVRDGSQRVWMERMPSSRQTCGGARHQRAFSKTGKVTARAKRVRAYFVLLSNSAVSKLTRESQGAAISLQITHSLR